MVGRLFGVFTPNAILTSDSSQAAWGAHLSFILRPNESLETQGRWDQNQMSLHINAKELLAVHMALKVWHCQLTDHSVKMESDNRTTVALINNQGTVKSLLLHNLTCDLLTWCHTRRIRIRAVCLPGILNVLADELSRPDQILHTEWSLDQKVVDGLFQLWGKPHIDLFASKVNLKLPTYVSPTQDPQAFAVDALSIDWRRMYAYAFPPPNLLTKVVHKNSSDLMPSEFGDALLAANAMVCCRSKTRSTTTKAHTDRPEPSLSKTRERTSGKTQKPAVFETSRLVSVKRSIKRLGFSNAVSARIATTSKRTSTSKVYDNRWSSFASWCHERDLDPMTCSIPRVADFLNHLFEVEKLASGTIAGYKSTIASTWQSCGNSTLVQNNTLRDLLRSFHIDRPRPIQSIPPWSLSLVLDALRYPPFEPMSTINLPNLTVKTVFLVALATGKRRSELHAMTLQGSGLAENKQYFILSMDRQFLAKSERLHRQDSKTIVIPALPSSETEERSICPVRALRFYCQRTSDIRTTMSAKKLFISYKQGFHGEISTQTVSRWISQAVIWSYAASARSPDLLRLHSVKAHEVRAYSASVALLRAVPLEDILKAACWKCHNTFTSHYLRDLTFESEDLLRLGPLVASQKLIQV